MTLTFFFLFNEIAVYAHVPSIDTVHNCAIAYRKLYFKYNLMLQHAFIGPTKF